MADKLSQRLNTFLLSAIELKALNPQWSDAMTQDYLNIFRNLAIIAEASDSQVDFGNGIESLIFNNDSMVHKVRVRLNAVEARPEPQNNDVFMAKNRVAINRQKTKADDLEQLLHAW